MRLDDLITCGWASWCPIAGQLWDWGIDPEEEFARFISESSWFINGDEEEEEFMFEVLEDFGPHIKFIGNYLYIKTTQWPPLHVWVGVALRLLLEYHSQIAYAYVVVRGDNEEKKIRVVLNEPAKAHLEKSWEDVKHGYVFRPQNKCQACFIKDLCWFLQEV